MRDLVVYTDGSVSQPNDGSGIGGWAYVCPDYEGPDQKFEYSGWTPNTTNNRMELTAAINAVSLAERGSFVTIITDSQYVQRCFARRRWPEKKPNADLGRWLMEAKHGRFVEVKFVPGHSGDKWNEHAHNLANKARLEGVEYEKRRAEEERSPTSPRSAYSRLEHDQWSVEQAAPTAPPLAPVRGRMTWAMGGPATRTVTGR